MKGVFCVIVLCCLKKKENAGERRTALSSHVMATCKRIQTVHHGESLIMLPHKKARSCTEAAQVPSLIDEHRLSSLRSGSFLHSSFVNANSFSSLFLPDHSFAPPWPGRPRRPDVQTSQLSWKRQKLGLVVMAVSLCHGLLSPPDMAPGGDSGRRGGLAPRPLTSFRPLAGAFLLNPRACSVLPCFPL